MREPEVYTIQWERIARTSVMQYKQYIMQFLNKECLCEHHAFRHECEIVKVPHELSDKIIFKKCQTSYCRCDMFKQDNLKWLEMKANG